MQEADKDIFSFSVRFFYALPSNFDFPAKWKYDELQS